LTQDFMRLTLAASITALYLLLVWLKVRGQWRAKTPAHGATDDWVVAYASQTGTAQFFAEQTAATLHSGGVPARCVSVAALDRGDLQTASRLLLVASTYGEGDAPDSAARLTRLLADPALALQGLHYGVLALGDASYQHFCGYGRLLEQQLNARGAQPLFPRIDVDRRDPAALAAWLHHLSHLAGTSDAPDWSGPAFDDWRIVERALVNHGSAGAPVFRLRLRPASGALPAWKAGDLVQVCPPGESEAPRDYSIASLPGDGVVELLVRLHVRDDGASGAASGWLCHGCTPADAVTLRLRAHPNFQLGENASRPLILIGNGTGIAGLRSLLKQRADLGEHRNWLLFGERNVAHDLLYEDDLDAWQSAGALPHLDRAFSRDGVVSAYVQDLLAAQAPRLREWVRDGAAIYVCGSLHGMAGAVHATLVNVLGEPLVATLQEAGRYRRDVY
jgi:sulfite reductase (NADPH) flavoprotein alpha-component